MSQLAQALSMGRHQSGSAIVAWDRMERRRKVLVRGGTEAEPMELRPKERDTVPKTTMVSATLELRVVSRLKDDIRTNPSLPWGDH